MTETGCKWPGCERHDGRNWCEEHYRTLPHHIRVKVARGDSDAEAEAITWIRTALGGEPRRERWDPGKWERLLRWVRERDEARARRRAAEPVLTSGGEDQQR